MNENLRESWYCKVYKSHMYIHTYIHMYMCKVVDSRDNRKTDNSDNSSKVSIGERQSERKRGVREWHSF